MTEDLFGWTPRQGDMFAEDVPSPPPPSRSADDVRAEMVALIAQARAAETMPWPARELRSHVAIFPYMARWLPGGEGEQLLLAFQAELERLERP